MIRLLNYRRKELSVLWVLGTRAEPASILGALLILGNFSLGEIVLKGHSKRPKRDWPTEDIDFFVQSVVVEDYFIKNLSIMYFIAP